MIKTLTVLTAAVLLTVFCCRVAKATESDELVAQLRASGIDEATATTISETLYQAQESENLDPILRLINKDEEAGFAAAALLGITEAGSQLLVMALKDGKIEKPEVMIHAFLFTKEKQAIDYLVERLAGEKSADVSQTIVSVLRVVCAQDIGVNGKAWQKWWKKNREEFSFPEEIDLDARSKAVQIESQRRNIRQVRGMMKKVMKETDKDNDASKVVEDMFGGMLQSLTDIADAAENLNYSDEAKKATKLFQEGELLKAEKQFRESLKKYPEERYSLYLLGCLLIENDKLEEAENLFKKISSLEKKDQMARFLRGYCRHRIRHKDEAILESLIYLAGKSEFDEGSMWGWNDEIIPALIGQSSIEEGLFIYDQEQLTRIMDENNTDAETVIGVALLRPKQNVLRVLETHEEEFSNSALYQASLVKAYIGKREEGYIEKVLEKTDILDKLAPDNGYFPLLAAYYRDYENSSSARDFDDPTLPLGKEAFAAVKDAIGAKVFDSYTTEVFKAPVAVLQKTGTPFAEMAGWNKGVSMFAPYGAYRDIGRRLRENSKNAMVEGKKADAISYAKLIVRLGHRVRSDNNLLINRLVAMAIEGIGYAQLADIYKETGEKDNLKRIEEEQASLKKQKKEISSRMIPVPFFIVPVPKIQKAFISATIEDETGLTLRFPKK